MLYAFLSNRWTLSIGIAAFILMHVYTGPILEDIHSRVEGQLILDARPPFVSGMLSWNAQDASSFLQQIGAEGQERYHYFLQYPDMFFSVVILPIFFMSLQVLVYRNPVIWVGILPGLFDTLENMCVLVLLAHYPEQPQFTVMVAPYFTTLKIMSIGLNLLTLVFGAGLKLRSALSSDSKQVL